MGTLPCLDVDSLKFRVFCLQGTTNGRKLKKKLAILVRDKFKCVVCDSPHNLTISHIAPLNKQGRHRRSYDFELNLCQTECTSCHVRKHTLEYLQNKRMKQPNPVEAVDAVSDYRLKPDDSIRTIHA